MIPQSPTETAHMQLNCRSAFLSFTRNKILTTPSSYFIMGLLPPAALEFLKSDQGDNKDDNGDCSDKVDNGGYGELPNLALHDDYWLINIFK